MCSRDVYGVTRRLLSDLAQHEIETRYIDVFDLDGIERGLAQSRARVLYFETVTNPLLRVPDARSLIELAHAAGASAVVDNTFATPYVYRPLEMGADIVVESATKYIAGHGDVIAGVVATSRSLAQRVRDARTVSGGILSPFEAWLTLRGIRTLPLRMERQSSTARRLAAWLADQPWVETVYYPGLVTHPQHAIARAEFKDVFGGMLAFDIRGGRESALRFMDALELVTPGTSLGDVESLALYPPLSSHRTLSPDELRSAGIGEGLIRMSVGVEHPDDLMEDLRCAACAAELVASP
jgi:cystathionine beta-lyase/cystathionine gamma-synthase